MGGVHFSRPFSVRKYSVGDMKMMGRTTYMGGDKVGNHVEDDSPPNGAEYVARNVLHSE